MIRFLLLSVAVLAMSGCARVIQGSTQDVSIETPGADGATCFIENEEFRYKTYAPQTIRMTKTVYPLNVRCLAPGNRQKTVVVPLKIQEETFMNVVNGLLPGMWYDHESRAFYKMPSKIVVDFTEMAPTAMPLPKYDRLLQENPHLRGWEEFRPGQPALQRDMYEETQELRRREVPVSATEGQSSVADESLSAPAAYEPMPLPAPTAGNADDLTRQMNPGLFSGNDDDWVK